MEREEDRESDQSQCVRKERERVWKNLTLAKRQKKFMYALKLDTILGDVLNTVKENNPEMEYEIEFKLLILIKIFLI